MKAYNLVLSWVFQAKVFIFVFYAIIYGCCAAIFNHMVDIAHFLLGPHIRSFWWWKIACHFDGTDFGELLHLTYKKMWWWGYVRFTLCFMPWHGHSNSETQMEALKNLLHHPCLYCIQPCLRRVWILFRTAIPTHLLETVFCLKLFLWIFCLFLPYLLWRQTYVLHSHVMDSCQRAYNLYSTVLVHSF